MRRILPIAFLLLAVGTVAVADEVRSIRIVSASGESVFPISQIVSIKFVDDSDMALTLTDGSSAVWGVNAVSNILHIWTEAVSVDEENGDDNTGDEENGGDNTGEEQNGETDLQGVDAHNLQLTLTGGLLIVRGADGAHITLCDIYGHTLTTDRANGVWHYDMSRHQQGVYVISIEGRTYKILNR